MKKSLWRLVHIVTNPVKQTPSTKTIHLIQNKIPCDYDSYFKPSTMESYILKEMGDYPIINHNLFNYQQDNQDAKIQDDSIRLS